MRLLGTVLAWLLATVLLAVAVPVTWVQANVIDADGYAALAQRAATDPVLQNAAAAELTTQAMRLIRERGYDVAPAKVHDTVAAYTAGSSFPGQFAGVNRALHHWLFSGGSGPAVVDVAPLLEDSEIRQTLAAYQVQLPPAVDISLAAPPAGVVPPDRLRPLTTWGLWISIGAVLLAAAGAVLTLFAARRRGRALVALGVSALLVGAAGYAGVEVGRAYLNRALKSASVTIGQIAGVMADYAEADMHRWLDVTLAGGGIAIAVGAAAAMLGVLLRR